MNGWMDGWMDGWCCHRDRVVPVAAALVSVSGHLFTLSFSAALAAGSSR